MRDRETIRKAMKCMSGDELLDYFVGCEQTLKVAEVRLIVQKGIAEGYKTRALKAERIIKDMFAVK